MRRGLGVQLGCREGFGKQIERRLLFILDSLLCRINCFILITIRAIFVDNVRRRYMLIYWQGLKS